MLHHFFYTQKTAYMYSSKKLKTKSILIPREPIELLFDLGCFLCQQTSEKQYEKPSLQELQTPWELLYGKIILC